MNSKIEKIQSRIRELDRAIEKEEDKRNAASRKRVEIFTANREEWLKEKKNGGKGVLMDQLEYFDDLEEQAAREAARLEDLRKIEQNNLKAVCERILCAELPTILKKYENKQLGEKTEKKIREEFQKENGFRVYFDRAYLSQKSESVLYSCEGLCGPASSYWLCASKTGTNDRGQIVNADNKITEVATWELTPCRKEIKKPSEYLKKLAKLKAAYNKAKKAEEEAAKAFKTVAVAGFEL